MKSGQIIWENWFREENQWKHDFLQIKTELAIALDQLYIYIRIRSGDFCHTNNSSISK